MGTQLAALRWALKLCPAAAGKTDPRSLSQELAGGVWCSLNPSLRVRGPRPRNQRQSGQWDAECVPGHRCLMLCECGCGDTARTLKHTRCTRKAGGSLGDLVTSLTECPTPEHSHDARGRLTQRCMEALWSSCASVPETSLPQIEGGPTMGLNCQTHLSFSDTFLFFCLFASRVRTARTGEYF